MSSVEKVTPMEEDVLSIDDLALQRNLNTSPSLSTIENPASGDAESDVTPSTLLQDANASIDAVVKDMESLLSQPSTSKMPTCKEIEAREECKSKSNLISSTSIETRPSKRSSDKRASKQSSHPTTIRMVDENKPSSSKLTQVQGVATIPPPPPRDVLPKILAEIPPPSPLINVPPFAVPPTFAVTAPPPGITTATIGTNAPGMSLPLYQSVLDLQATVNDIVRPTMASTNVDRQVITNTTQSVIHPVGTMNMSFITAAERMDRTSQQVVESNIQLRAELNRLTTTINNDQWYDQYNVEKLIATVNRQEEVSAKMEKEVVALRQLRRDLVVLHENEILRESPALSKSDPEVKNILLAVQNLLQSLLVEVKNPTVEDKRFFADSGVMRKINEEDTISDRVQKLEAKMDRMALHLETIARNQQTGGMDKIDETVLGNILMTVNDLKFEIEHLRTYGGYDVQRSINAKSVILSECPIMIRDVQLGRFGVYPVIIDPLLKRSYTSFMAKEFVDYAEVRNRNAEIRFRWQPVTRGLFVALGRTTIPIQLSDLQEQIIKQEFVVVERRAEIMFVLGDDFLAEHVFEINHHTGHLMMLETHHGKKREIHVPFSYLDEYLVNVITEIRNSNVLARFHTLPVIAKNYSADQINSCLEEDARNYSNNFIQHMDKKPVPKCDARGDTRHPSDNRKSVRESGKSPLLMSGSKPDTAKPTTSKTKARSPSNSSSKSGQSRNRGRKRGGSRSASGSRYFRGKQPK